MFLRAQDKHVATLVDARATRFDWIVAVFLLIIQQYAFIPIPTLLSRISPLEVRDIQRDPWNTGCIAISLVLIVTVCARWTRHIGVVVRTNQSSLLFLMLVLMSSTWSLHPDDTIRRGVGYVLTVLIAAYLTVRFECVDRMRVLSASFAVAAIGSLLFALACPQYGIMHEEGSLAGSWRGVFMHKEGLGCVMSVAVLTELFLIVVLKGRSRWRFALLGVFLSLTVLSHAATCILLALAYMVGTGLYLLWQRDEVRSGHLSAIAVILLFAAGTTLWINPTATLSVLGKDSTLSGRTPLWGAVIELIRQRPLVGWGYRAMFRPGDAPTALIDSVSDWGASSSHNAFLEITLELGVVGACVILMIIVVALRRGLICFTIGPRVLGWYSLMFMIGSIVGGMTLEGLGQNQSIVWLVFNVLSFSCGLSILSAKGIGVSPSIQSRRSAVEKG